MRLLIIEPWFGESHRALFAGVAEHTRWNATLVTLPAEKWRWRMRLGAYHLRAQIESLDGPPDALLVSDYVHLPVLKQFAPAIRSIPTAVYFLENQFTYPARDGQKRDFEFMAINLLTCLAAEAVLFCSAQQRDTMLEAIPAFLKHDREADVEATVEEISEKSQVIPIGVDLARFDRARESRPDRRGMPLSIAWPHRFEHDKNPEDLLEVVRDLDRENLPFEITLLGRAYRDMPEALGELRAAFPHRIAHFGFLEGAAYAGALAASDVVLSTAWQETQGVAVIEAVRAGCDPLLPSRLSYPEILGPELAEKHLYTTKGDLRRRLRWMMRHPDRVRATADHAHAMERFGWQSVAPRFDALLARLAHRGR